MTHRDMLMPREAGCRERRVPKGWSEGKVSDLLVGLESGVSVNGKDRKIEPNEMAVLKVSAVSYGVFDSAAAKVVDGEELGRAKTNPKQGQIIISRSNTEELVGASAYVDADHPDRFLPDKLWQTVPKLDSDMKWLSYVLASDHSRYTLSNLATGTSGSMKNITKGELLGFKVLIPPLPEQKKIAQILSTWDKAITTTEQRLTNSQQQKKALMQQLLTGKQRLLDQNGERFKGEWLRNSLKDLVEIIYGKSPKEVVSPTGSYPIYGTGGIGGFASEPLCEEIAVLIGRKGTIDKPPYISEPFWAIDTTFYCLPKTGTDLKWFYYLVSSLKLRIYSEASGVPSLSRETLNAIKVSVPSTTKEQQKIAAVLTAADQEITSLQQQLDHLKQEKKALMQQLLTGKRRVKVEPA